MGFEDMPLNFGGTDAPASDQTTPTTPVEPAGDKNPFANLPALGSFMQSQRDPNAGLFNAQTYDINKTSRYESSPIYSDYLDPNADNETWAARSQTGWDAITAGMGGFKDSFATGFKESLYTWPRMGAAFVSADISKLVPDEYELMRESINQEKSQQENAIYMTEQEQNEVFNTKTFGQLLTSLGYTFGTLTEIGAEAALTWGVGSLFKLGASKSAALTAKAGVTEGERVAFELGKAEGIRGSSAGAVSASSAKVMDDAAEEIIKRTGLNNPSVMRGMFDTFVKGASKVPFIGNAVETGQLIAKGAAAGLGPKELAKIGYGGFRRTFGEWQAAAGEAAIEAGSIYGQVYDNLYSDFYNKNGRDPNSEEQSRMLDMARDAASNGFGTNVAVLGVMNRIQFGNIMSHIVPDTAIIRALKDEAAETIAVTGLKGGEKLTKLYTPGMMGRIGLLPEIAADFGKKTAIKQLGIGALKGTFAGVSIAEGLQENIQEGTGAFLTDYYSKMYNNDPASFGDSFKYAMSQQNPFDAGQGTKTFLMGAVTGMFIHPTMKVIGGASNMLTTSAADRAQYKKDLADQVQAMNTILADPSKVMSEQIKAIKEQVAASEKMQEAVANKDRFSYLNNRESALISAVHTAKRLGKLGILKDVIKSYGESFTNEEFKEAFGFDPSETGYASASEFTNRISGDIQRYSDIYDNYYKKYADYINMSQYINDPYRKQSMDIGRAALLDAIQTISFNESKAQDSLKRSGEIAKNVSRFKSIGQSLASAFMRIADPEEIDEERKILINELANLKQTENPDEAVKQQIARKENELKHLQEFQRLSGYKLDEQSNQRSFNTSELKNNAENRKLAAQALSAYLQSRNEGAGIKTQVKAEEIEEAMDDIVDFMMLNEESRNYIDANNALADPQMFMDRMQNYANARVGAHARLIVDHYKTLAESSDLFQEFYTANKDVFEELELFAASPLASTKNYVYLNELIDKITEKAKTSVNKFQEDTIAELEKQMQEEFEKASEQSEVVPQNLILMEFEGKNSEVIKFIRKHYIVTPIPGTNSVKVQRVDNAADPKLVTHEFEYTPTAFKSTEDYIKEFESELFYDYVPTETNVQTEKAVNTFDSSEVEKIEEDKQAAIQDEKRKLKYHIGEKLIYKGKVGVLRESADNVEGGRVEVELVTEDGIFIFDDADMMIDLFPGLQLFENQPDTNIQSVTVNDRKIEAKFTDDTEQFAVINGVQYEVLRNPKTGNITGLAYYNQKGQRRVGRGGVFAEYITALNVLPNKIQQALDALPVDEATDLVKRAGDDSVNADLLERVLSFEMPVEEFDKFLDGRTRKSLTLDELIRLTEWGEGVITRLEKLNQNSEEVQNMLEYMYNFLNDLENINFVNNGKQPTTDGKSKSTKRATKRSKKAAANVVSTQPETVTTEKTEPVKRRKGKKADIGEAVVQLELKFEEKKKQVRTRKNKKAKDKTAEPETLFTISTANDIQKDIISDVDAFMNLTERLEQPEELSSESIKFETGGEVFNKLSEAFTCTLKKK